MKDFDHMIYAMKKYVIIDFAFENTIQIISANELPILLMILFGILHAFSFKKGNLPERISGLKMSYWILILFIIFLTTSLSYVGDGQEFIYFQF